MPGQYDMFREREREREREMMMVVMMMIKMMITIKMMMMIDVSPSNKSTDSKPVCPLYSQIKFQVPLQKL